MNTENELSVGENSPQPPEQTQYQETDPHEILYPSETMQSTPEETAVPAQTRSVKKAIYSSVITLIVLLLIGVAGLYAKEFMYSNSTLEKVLLAFHSAKTFSHEGTISFQMETDISTNSPEAYPYDLSSDIGVEVSLKGSSDKSTESHPKSKNDITISFSTQNGPFQIKDSASITLYVDGIDRQYITFNSTPEMLAMFGLSAIQGKTLRIDREYLEEYAGVSFDEESAEGEIDTITGLNNMSYNFEKFDVITLENPEKVQFSTPTGESLNVKKYQLIFNPDGAKKLFLAMLDDAEITKGMSEEEREAVNRLIYVILPKISFTDSAVWVGNDDLPYRLVINVSLQIDGEDVVAMLNEDTNTSLDGTTLEKVSYAFETDMSFYDYDAPVRIEYPRDAVPIQEFMQQITQEMQQQMNVYEPESQNEIYYDPMSVNGKSIIVALLNNMVTQSISAHQDTAEKRPTPEKSWIDDMMANAVTPILELF